MLCDASDDDDVEVTAELALREALPIAASDPLVVALALRLAEGLAPAPPPPALPSGRTAVIAGARAPW